jgi:two-component system, NarL family, nitrate/nitrite response regulator NarL
MTSSSADKGSFLPAQLAATVPTIIMCDNSITRLGLAHLLSNTGFQVVDAESPTNAWPPSFQLNSVALIIVSAGGNANEAADTVEQLKRESLAAKIVVLADSADVAAITRAYRAGADGLLLATARHDALIKALELIMMGERLFPSTALLDVTQEINQPQTHAANALQSPHSENVPPLLRNLSEREKEVLSHLITGAQDKVIARDLNLAEATVKVHVKSLFKKLGAQNRTQAAVLASSYLS